MEVEADPLVLARLEESMKGVVINLNKVIENQERFGQKLHAVEITVARTELITLTTKACVDTHEGDINRLKSAVGRHGTYFKITGGVITVTVTILASVICYGRELVSIVRGAS